MTTDYEHQDHSILLPPLKRFVFDPLLRRIPETVSANSITLLGTAMSATALAIGAVMPTTRFNVALVALLILGYVTLDNIDGSQARRTGTGTPLGEFLDHWLDSLNNAFLYMGGVLIMDMPPTYAILMLALGTVSYSLVFWEQRVTGHMHMSWYGNLEGVISIVGVYVLATILGPAFMFHTPIHLVGLSFTFVDFMVWFATAGTLGNCAGVLIRARSQVRGTLVVFAPVAAVMVWFFAGNVPILMACVLLMVLSPALAGRMLVARLAGNGVKGPDQFLVIGIVGASLLCVVFPVAPLIQHTFMALLIGYGSLTVVLDFVGTVEELDEFVRPDELLAFRPRLRRRS